MADRSDGDMLRRFEPIIRYTRGERFFPMDVGRYIENASLWVQRPNQYPLRLWGGDSLTLDRLAEPRAHGFNAVYYVKFIDPMNITDLVRYRLREGLTRRDDESRFRAGPGRLARVGYGSRFVDALFSLSLLVRGRVPGDTAMAAAQAYRWILAEDERYCYYGRVVRQKGWIVLQYWFFYAYNNWRSGYAGANDHEGDWEMICLYLYEEDRGQLRPEWVAYASHDFSGDDLRRRWDDPELLKENEHPVIFAGAGSHASYFQPGEYLAELEIPLVRPILQFVDRVQLAWEKNILPYRTEVENGARWSEFSIFRVPFVDYARGDGLAIGPGQANTWGQPVLIEPPPPWVSQYRGLWGLFAQDPFSGENAPAGPMYNRDGTVRRAWFDPVGWAGLDKIPPPNERLIYIAEQKADIQARREQLRADIAQKHDTLRGLGVEMAAIQARPHLRRVRDERGRQIEELADELKELRAQLASDDALGEALEMYAGRIQAGERGPVRGHITRAHQPTSAAGLRLNRFAELWAAVSIGLSMVSFILLVLFARDYLLFGVGATVSVLIFVEASFRRRINRFISSVTVGLAVASALILLFEFFWEAVIIAVLVAGSYIMWENIRELRR